MFRGYTFIPPKHPVPQLGRGYENDWDSNDSNFVQNAKDLKYHRIIGYDEQYCRSRYSQFSGPRDVGYTNVPSHVDFPPFRNSPYFPQGGNYINPRMSNQYPRRRLKLPPNTKSFYGGSKVENSAENTKSMPKRTGQKPLASIKTKPKVFPLTLEKELQINSLWITETLKAMMKEKYELYEKQQKAPNTENSRAYRNSKELLEEKLLLTKLEFLGNNPKKDVTSIIRDHSFEDIIRVAAKYLIAWKAGDDEVIAEADNSINRNQETSGMDMTETSNYLDAQDHGESFQFDEKLDADD